MDNLNWLKWIIVKKQGDGMALSTEDVPGKNGRSSGAAPRAKEVKK
jgi:hypothetical protein